MKEITKDKVLFMLDRFVDLSDKLNHFSVASINKLFDTYSNKNYYYSFSLDNDAIIEIEMSRPLDKTKYATLALFELFSIIERFKMYKNYYSNWLKDENIESFDISKYYMEDNTFSDNNCKNIICILRNILNHNEESNNFKIHYDDENKSLLLEFSYNAYNNEFFHILIPLMDLKQIFFSIENKAFKSNISINYENITDLLSDLKQNKLDVNILKTNGTETVDNKYIFSDNQLHLILEELLASKDLNLDFAKFVIYKYISEPLEKMNNLNFINQRIINIDNECFDKIFMYSNMFSNKSDNYRFIDIDYQRKYLKVIVIKYMLENIVDSERLDLYDKGTLSRIDLRNSLVYGYWYLDGENIHVYNRWLEDYDGYEITEDIYKYHYIIHLDDLYDYLYKTSMNLVSNNEIKQLKRENM